MAETTDKDILDDAGFIKCWECRKTNLVFHSYDDDGMWYKCNDCGALTFVG